MEKDSTLRVPLKEQENLKELFHMLEEHGMEREKTQVIQMADYIDGMEEKMEAVLAELKGMREQISGIENKGLRAKAEKLVKGVTEKVEDVRDALSSVKSAFLAKVDRAVQAGKSKGREALAGILRTIHLPGMMMRVQRQLGSAIATTDRGIEKLGNMADQVHGAKQHLENAGRVLFGKKAKKLDTRDPEQGAVYHTQRLMFQSMMSMIQMEQKTQNLLDRVDRLTGKDETQRTSVKDTIQELKSDRLTVSESPHRERREAVRG